MYAKSDQINPKKEQQVQIREKKETRKEEESEMEKIAMMEQLARSILGPHEVSLQKCRYAIGIDVLAQRLPCLREAERGCSLNLFSRKEFSSKKG